MCASFAYIINTKTTMVLLTLIIVVLFIGIFYIYIKRSYFTLYGSIPGIPPHFLVGNLIQTDVIGKNIPFNIIFLDLKAKFGDVFQYWLGPSRMISINRLEDIQHIFSHRHIYDQGELFTEKISLVNPYAILCLTGSNIFFSIYILSYK